jgi:Family of unknown function (DUF6501)
MSKMVRCINNNYLEVYQALTLMKVYKVLKENDDYFFIVNDKGNCFGYYKNRFSPEKDLDDLYI